MPELPEQNTPEVIPASRLSELIMKHRFFIAAIGVIGMGCVSGLTNVDHGVSAMGNAAINQMIHSGISASVIMQGHKSIAKRCKTKISQIVPIIIPAAISTAVCYAIHKLGIPYLREPSAEPEYATIPTAIALSIVIPIYHFAYYRSKLKSLLGQSEIEE